MMISKKFVSGLILYFLKTKLKKMMILIQMRVINMNDYNLLLLIGQDRLFFSRKQSENNTETKR